MRESESRLELWLLGKPNQPVPGSLDALKLRVALDGYRAYFPAAIPGGLICHCNLFTRLVNFSCLSFSVSLFFVNMI